MGLRSVLKGFMTIVLCALSTYSLYAQQGGFEQFNSLAEKHSAPPHDFPEGSNIDFSGAPDDVASCSDPENIIDEYHFLLYLAFAPEQIDIGLATENTPRTVGLSAAEPTETTPDFAGSKRIFSAGDLNGDGCHEVMTLQDDISEDELRRSLYILAIFLSSNTLEEADERIEAFLNDDLDETESVELALEPGYQFDSFITEHDYDGDGYDDLLLGSESEASDMFHTAFGNMMLDNLDFHSFSMSSLEKTVANTDDFFRFNAADIDDDGNSEVIILSSVQNLDFSVTGRIRVFDIDENRASTLIQDITLPAEFSSSAINLNFYALDIDGADEPNPIELLFLPREPLFGFFPGANAQVIDTDSETGEFVSEIQILSDQYISPVGDLNNDGRHDFLIGDENGKPFIAFGPADISSGLVLDVALSTGNDPDFEFEHPPYIRSGRYGDLNGDGIDDTILGHIEDANQKIGRRFVYGSGDGNLTSEFGLYDRNVFYNTFASSANVGDVNGDGVEDYALVRDEEYLVDIYFGREVLNLSPDVVLEADRLLPEPKQAIGGDFNNDGYSDIALATQDKLEVDVYFGGEEMDGAADHRFDPYGSEDSGDHAAVFPANIGDINNDGIDDFLIPSGFVSDSEGNFLNKAWIFYGSSTLSASPDITIDYNTDPELSGSFRNIGTQSISLGDINGDGVDDFAIGIGGIVTDGFASGGAYVYYGIDETAKSAAASKSSIDFTSPDIILRPTFDDITNISGGRWLAAGDFDGEGSIDIAMGINNLGNEDGSEFPVIQIYKGGEMMDDSADAALLAPAEAFGGNVEDGYFAHALGSISFLPDDDGDGMQDLLMTTTGGFQNGTNAVIYKSSSDSIAEPSSVLVASNPAIGLGGSRVPAAGDFNNDGNNDIILVQASDNRDSFRSSRAYLYSPGADSVAVNDGNDDDPPVSIDENGVIPSRFSLSQNYPNPFNPSTLIRYQLPVNSRVRLEIFDVLGRQVATLVDGKAQPAGEYSKHFDASHLASGMYIYRLAAGDFVQTRKMLLVK